MLTLELSLYWQTILFSVAKRANYRQNYNINWKKFTIATFAYLEHFERLSWVMKVKKPKCYILGSTSDILKLGIFAGKGPWLMQDISIIYQPCISLLLLIASEVFCHKPLVKVVIPAHNRKQFSPSLLLRFSMKSHICVCFLLEACGTQSMSGLRLLSQMIQDRLSASYWLSFSPLNNFSKAEGSCLSPSTPYIEPSIKKWGRCSNFMN